MGNSDIPVDPFTIPQKSYLSADISRDKQRLLQVGLEPQAVNAVVEFLQTYFNGRSVAERQNYNVIETALRQVRLFRGLVNCSDSTTTGTSFPLVVDSIDIDDGGFFTVGSATMNAPFTGFYTLTQLSIFAPAGAAGNYRRVQPHGFTAQQHLGTTAEVTISGSVTEFLEKGDTFGCFASQDTGGNLAVTSRIELVASAL